MAHTHKLVDGVKIDLTAEEISELNAKDEIETKRFAKQLHNKRQFSFE